jgi:dipeptidyl aminopeptidase/acylaminoacyl peptidase
MVDKFIGSGAHVAAGSPLRQAPSIAVPVLLVHGDQDVNVGYQHAVRMDAALRKAGKPSELLLFKGLDHQLEDSEARALMLKKAGELLDRTIGRP